MLNKWHILLVRFKNAHKPRVFIADMKGIHHARQFRFCITSLLKFRVNTLLVPIDFVYSFLGCDRLVIIPIV